MKALRESRLKLYSFFNLSARLWWMVNATPRPLYPREREPVPTGGRVGPRGGSGRVRKISPPLLFDPQTVQPVATRYTDWTTGPTTNITVQDLQHVAISAPSRAKLRNSLGPVELQILCIRLQVYFMCIVTSHTRLNNAFTVYFTTYCRKSDILCPYILVLVSL